MIHFIAQPMQMSRHPWPPVEGRLRVLLINETHQLQVERGLAGRVVIERRSIESDQITLPTNADGCMGGVDHHAFDLNWIEQLFF